MPARKVSDGVIVESYARLGSVYLVGAEVGLNHASVHERLVKLGANRPMRVWTAKENERLSQEYDHYANLGELDVLAKSMSRTKQFIARKARDLGLTNYCRPASPRERLAMGPIAKARIAQNGHPRGALGMKHTPESLRKIGEASSRAWSALTEEEKSDRVEKRMKTRLANGTALQERVKVTWKGGWREIGQTAKYYRSSWEANYARYLEWLKSIGEITDWQHEPTTFWFEGIKRGCRSYLPDFLVIEKNGAEVYHEVKGWMDDRSKTKIKRMAIYHPTVKLIVIDSKQYRALQRKVKRLVPGWES